MIQCTVIGGRGFIGSEVVKVLSESGYNVHVPEKNAPEIFTQDLGIVIYCAGNGDCANNPMKVLDSNVTLLANILEKSNFDRLIYLSSTRLYVDRETSLETDPIIISPEDPRRLFNLTKLTAEELCLKSKKNIVILRPSNVYGPAINSPLFLPMIVKNALMKKHVDMFVVPEYAKDYLSVKDLTFAILEFVKMKDWSGVDIFNVASGENVTAADIAKVIRSKTDCEVKWHPGFIGEKFPPSSIVKLQSIIAYRPSHVLSDLDKMIEEFSGLLKINQSDK